jgi:type II secretory pathway component PulC
MNVLSSYFQKLSTILLLPVLFITGCSDSNDFAKTQNTENVLASINQTNTIKRHDLPMADQIKLFNSEFQLHQLTLASLRETIERKHNPNDQLMWQLTPPTAPQLPLNLEPSWQQTFNPAANSESALSLDIMCSYASRPCGDIMNALEEFSKYSQQMINVKFYDYWQPYHKNAMQAAAAVYCSQGQAKTQLQQALWLRQGNINMQQLTSNIDVYNHQTKRAGEIYSCMQSNDTIGFLQNNHKSLQQLGVRQTPSMLINGQYVSRGHEVSKLFNSLYPSMNLAIEQGDREVTWLQSWLAVQTNQNISTHYNWAILEHSGQVLRLGKGSNVGDLYLAQIEKERIVFYKHGRLLSFGKPPLQPLVNQADTQQDMNTDQQYTQTSDSVQESHDTEIDDSDHKARYERAISNVKPQSLPQSWLEEQLMRQSELEESLFHTDGKIDGKALVKLDKENIDEFYSSLGMMPGDVIMRVNDDWIHEESNTLFQSLANEEKVTISVMRKGLPVHLAFEVTQ